MKAVSYRNPEQDRNRMCRLKAVFATEARARRANLSHRPYRCPYCGRWHLASQAGKGVER